MDTSVKSTGTCAVDMEASVDIADYSDATPLGSLRSATILTPPLEPYLPSYLSLACTVNGYSTITKYDSQRFSKSRDASPNRAQEQEYLTAPASLKHRTYSNLLSPPNLIHLPTVKLNLEEKLAVPTMENRTIIIASSTKTTSVSQVKNHSITKQVAGISEEGGSYHRHNEFKKFETKALYSKYSTETKEFLNTRESKSFIQQRVERLYGPGALAQGFFATKRQKSKNSELYSEQNFNASTEDGNYAKSFSDNFGENEVRGTPMKQSCSSPALPVLRHLRPEFRAQLPIISPRKHVKEYITKSNTVTKFADQAEVIAQPSNMNRNLDQAVEPLHDVSKNIDTTGLSDVKDGHYFLELCEKEIRHLLSLAATAEAEAEQNDLSEEVRGKLRSAYGKARLLVSQKMEQFKGLCANNIKQSTDEQFPTTNDDLQGFWDMVMLQVDEVNAVFAEVEELRKCNWKQVTDEESKTNGKLNGTLKKLKKVPSTKSTTPSNEALRKQRDAARKQMIEARRKAMKAQKQPSQSIEIFLPESS